MQTNLERLTGRLPGWARHRSRRWLAAVAVVLVIDAVNQLDPGHQAHSMRWLPEELPPGARLEETYAVAEEARRIITAQFPDEVRLAAENTDSLLDH